VDDVEVRAIVRAEIFRVGRARQAQPQILIPAPLPVESSGAVVVELSIELTARQCLW
jgi:hypothetical protein